MRYLGNKDLITSEIHNLLARKGLLKKKMTFFDAFCGTGAVSEALKDEFNIIANDNLTWCTLFTKGRIRINDCHFNNLGFDPFEYLNSSNEAIHGFFYKNYSPGGSRRMYFSAENAARIDFFRKKIEEWNTKELISNNEYCYLLSCLIESISAVSNTAGVYGAYLKHWDPRAKKPIQFNKVEARNVKSGNLTVYNKKIEDIIEDIECDILYLDPPYTQNQYGTQYHLLETLVLDDEPSISPITGSRKTAPMRSDWSKAYKANILFDQILAKTKAKYIILSYSSDGLMSKDFIEASLKRYGKLETYECKKIAYKKYRNFKTRTNDNHFEYLFFVEKKPEHEIRYESPLNYIGSKAKMISEIKKNLPVSFDSFIDAFGGGFNVGINMNTEHIVFNDINHFVKDLVESFKVHDTYKYIQFIKKTIKQYDLKKAEAKGYLKLRKHYNSLPLEARDPRMLYTLILYGYNQQIRFNGNHDFNNPVGMRWFNDKVLEKMVSFSRALKEKNIVFASKGFLELSDEIRQNTFFYMDPPYRLTTGSYNDGKRGFKGWDKNAEKKLFDFGDELHKNGKHFMLSYVMEHKGKINEQLKSWIQDKGYRLKHINEIPGINRKEVLIVNYD